MAIARFPRTPPSSPLHGDSSPLSPGVGAPYSLSAPIFTTYALLFPKRCPTNMILLSNDHRLLDYRRPEVEALAELFGAFKQEDCSYSDLALQWKLPDRCHLDSPFHFVHLPSEDIARNIAAPSILLKGIYELWGEGITYQELEDAVNAYDNERKLSYLVPESTFKVNIDNFGKVFSTEEQKKRINRLSFIPFKGRVNLKHSEHKFWLMETDDYGSNNRLPPIVEKRIFFGRQVGVLDRKLLPTYQLKSRNYLGPTTMDAEMAFLMANQGLVAPGKFVYDPFVGTGSILVGAARFGAMTMVVALILLPL